METRKDQVGNYLRSPGHFHEVSLFQYVDILFCFVATEDLTCSNNNGQCKCRSNIDITAKHCDKCVTDYYWNPAGQGCVPCSCNVAGSVGSSCNITGQCACKSNVGGLRCDHCLPGYYGFNSGR